MLYERGVRVRLAFNSSAPFKILILFIFFYIHNFIDDKENFILFMAKY